MSKISIYHSSIKVKSKNIKSNVVKDYICCLSELQIISCRRQLKKIHGTHGPHGFYLKIIISGHRPYLKKDFHKRFLALAQPKNIHLRSDDYTKKKRRYSHTTSSAQKNPYLIYFCSCKYTNKTDTLQIFPYIFLFLFVKIKLFLPQATKKNPRNTRRTRILVKDSSQDFR